jgi:hypothetical protein
MHRTWNCVIGDQAQLSFTWGWRQNPVSETLFLDENRVMDNVQKYNIRVISYVLYVTLADGST